MLPWQACIHNLVLSLIFLKFTAFILDWIILFQLYHYFMPIKLIRSLVSFPVAWWAATTLRSKDRPCTHSWQHANAAWPSRRGSTLGEDKRLQHCLGHLLRSTIAFPLPILAPENALGEKKRKTSPWCTSMRAMPINRKRPLLSAENFFTSSRKLTYARYQVERKSNLDNWWDCECTLKPGETRNPWPGKVSSFSILKKSHGRPYCSHGFKFKVIKSGFFPSLRLCRMVGAGMATATPPFSFLGELAKTLSLPQTSLHKTWEMKDPVNSLHSATS